MARQYFLYLITTFFITVLFPINTYSQFLNKNAVWVSGLRCAPDFSCEWYYYYDNIKKDTVIQDINYSIFNTWGGRLALREAGGKIYYKGVKKNTIQIDTVERIMYDFNLLVNDTFDLLYRFQDTIKWKVKSIDSILIGNDYKKKINLEEISSQYIRKTSIIEDIGSLYGPFWISLMSTPSKYDSKLSCYIVDDIPLFGECNTVGLENIEAEKIPIVFYDQGFNPLARADL